MKRQYYIYVWYKEDTGEPFYVGKGKENRYRELVNRNRYFMNTYKKHGGYSQIILAGLTEQEAFKREVELIHEYRKWFKLVNITNGGEGVSGLKHSKETKNKLSALAKEQWKNQSSRQKLIESRKEIYSRPERSRKLSQSHTGKKFSNNHKQNHKKAMNQSKTVKKLAEAKTKYRNIKCVNKCGDGPELMFIDTREAVSWLKANGFSTARIATLDRCLAGNRKTAYGFNWLHD